MGFVFEFGAGPRIYVTGDTDYSELLVSAARHKPDLVITCINGGFNNLSHWEAADIVGKIRPRAAIPCHYDMFRDNMVDPGQFAASLKLRARGVGYIEMGYGTPLVFSSGG
jgi:L-ascorbate 6-phosphate lactonase